MVRQSDLILTKFSIFDRHLELSENVKNVRNNCVVVVVVVVIRNRRFVCPS